MDRTPFSLSSISLISNISNSFRDINKIVPFVSVDAIVGSTMSLQLAREANIQSTPNTEGLGFQSL